MYGNRKFKGFAPTNYLDLDIGGIWQRAMYGSTMISENENAYVSTFGCCVTSACAPKRARRTAFKQEMK